ncbi:hypothetical protein GCM10010988_22300 [Cnuibacter physcomitrellae]|nr:hypothetical protein [Cnuibacter physcomitrellae]GGI39084.1 hypothetical protein GCM10010988_22300 [Cnuibacter physcomitrellae]
MAESSVAEPSDSEEPSGSEESVWRRLEYGDEDRAQTVWDDGPVVEGWSQRSGVPDGEDVGQVDRGP